MVPEGDGLHEREQLVDGRAKAAAVYPRELCGRMRKAAKREAGEATTALWTVHGDGSRGHGRFDELCQKILDRNGVGEARAADVE